MFLLGTGGRKISWIAEMGPAPFLAGMLFLLASASASMNGAGRTNTLDGAFNSQELEKILFGEDPNLPNAYPKNYCPSCLEISRKAEKLLTDPLLQKKVDFFFTTICEIVPSGFHEKCEKMVEMYKNDAIMFLQDAFLEENFCNSSGICSNAVQASFFPSSRRTKLVSAMLPFANMLSRLWKGFNMGVVHKFSFNEYASDERENPLMLQSNGTCTTCISILEKVRTELEEPDKQLKIISALLKACETEVFVNKCKKLIFAYGPIVITNIQKIVSMDLCHMAHICWNPKNQTNHQPGPNSLPHINVSPAHLDVI